MPIARTTDEFASRLPSHWHAPRRDRRRPHLYEEHGDPGGAPLVALHGGIVTFQGSLGDILPWPTEGRRVIGVELQGHGHTPDTGRAMSIERFADDVAQLIDRVAGGGPVDVWGFSLMQRTDELRALLGPFLQ